MSKYLSNRKFAKLCEVSPSAITRAIKAGLVWRTESGIDPDHPTNQHYQEAGRRGANRQAKRKRAKAAKKKAERAAERTAKRTTGEIPETKPTRTKTVEEVREELSETEDEARRVFERALPPGDAALAAARFSRQSAEHLKVIEGIREKQIKNDRERLKLVDRDLVRRLFGELYLIHTNQFKTMGSKLSGPIAAAAGVDNAETLNAIEAIIEREVFRNLDAVKTMFERGLKKMKTDLPEEAVEEVSS